MSAARADDLFLRVVICGSVDDGKSTLAGRLLYDCGAASEDLDLSLLLDGRASEREQTMTIDVAFRQLRSARSSFLLVDSPGHEQYTRNMASAASQADAALVLVDARKGVLLQTRRHMAILALLGFKKVAAIVNKMDLVAYDRAVFGRLRDDLVGLARTVRLPLSDVIPVSALAGDNVVVRRPALAWQAGPTALEWMENASQARSSRSAGPFRMWVQSVVRPDRDKRGLAGQIAGGAVAVGDRIAVAGARPRPATVRRILAYEGDLPTASEGDPVTILLDEDIDVGRGDVIAAVDHPVEFSDRFEANVIWLAEDSLATGRAYVIKIGTRLAMGAVSNVKYRLDLETGERLLAPVLHCNDIGYCRMRLREPIPFEAHAKTPEMGRFLMIDGDSGDTVAAGVIEGPCSTAENVRAQHFDVDRAARSHWNGHQSAIVWLTGLSAAGKSTLANLAERRLNERGVRTYVLDGDNLRRGLNKDLGFTDIDRIENIRRAAETARLIADAGLVVIVALISPFQRERSLAREIAGDIPFLEIFVDAPIAVCADRDPKGLYRKAKSGALKNFTGIDSAYEPPLAPDLRLDSGALLPEPLARQLIDKVMSVIWTSPR